MSKRPIFSKITKFFQRFFFAKKREFPTFDKSSERFKYDLSSEDVSSNAQLTPLQPLQTSSTMAIMDYGVGGNVRDTEASEAFADIPQNRTLFLQQLTADEPLMPEKVDDLRTMTDVFNHFRPNVDVTLKGENDSDVEENLRFHTIADFTPKKLMEQSPTMRRLAVQEDQYLRLAKQLRTNKMMGTLVKDSTTREAFTAVLRALLQEIEEAKNPAQ